MAKKVFFVDDEIVIRENIRTCIDWQKEGFDYCGDAPDGEVALPLIEEHRPDILITDIKMPFMNGLELSAIVRKRLPNTKIILLSGHDEFEYARQGLRIGVEEYSLKPFGSADILRLLRNVSDKIDKENERRAEIDRLTGSLMEKEHAAREQLIAKLCGGLITSAEAVETAAALGIQLIARHYAVLLTDIRLPGDEAGQPPDAVAAVESQIEAAIRQSAECFASRRSRTETVWVIKSDRKDRLQAWCDRIAETLRPIEEAAGCSIAIGLGSVQDRLQGVHASFLEAEEDKYWRKMTEQHQALFVRDAAFEQGLYLDREAFLDFLTIGSPRTADAFIRQFAAGLAALDWNTSLFGCYLLNDLTLEVIRRARKLYRAAESADEAFESMKRHIRAVKCWDDACEYLRKLAELFWRWRADSAGRYAELIAQVKAFVQTHYGKEGLSLQDAADHVNVSASHLSKVFSQETGQTFIEFLMLTRVRKAMERMQSSNAKSYEIAHEVGYNDPHYFSNLFKRVTGVTIREFRKNGLPHDSPLREGGGHAS